MFECTLVEKIFKNSIMLPFGYITFMKCCYYNNVELLTVIEFVMYNAAEIFFCCLFSYLYIQTSSIFFSWIYLNHHLNMNLFKQQKKKKKLCWPYATQEQVAFFIIVEIVIQIQSNAFFLYEFLFSSNLWENA